MNMRRTANIIIEDVIHIFASISKIMRILLMGRCNRERCMSIRPTTQEIHENWRFQDQRDHISTDN